MISSDDKRFGGHGRIDNTVEHFTHPEGTPGEEFLPACSFRPQDLRFQRAAMRQFSVYKGEVCWLRRSAGDELQ